eukprot:3647297-Lingulodinium_polyedra.AAC.1
MAGDGDRRLQRSSSSPSESSPRPMRSSFVLAVPADASPSSLGMMARLEPLGRDSGRLRRNRLPHPAPPTLVPGSSPVNPGRE